MRPKEVQDAEVISAGQQLQRDGKRVTGYSLRMALDGRGAQARLMAVWDAFVSHALDPAAAEETAQLPIGVDELLRAAMTQQASIMRTVANDLQAAAFRHAEQKISERDVLIEELKKSHAAELADTLQTIDALRLANSQKTAEIESLGVHLAAEQRQREAMANELSQLRSQAEESTAAIASLKGTLAAQAPRLEELESELQAATSENNALQDEVAHLIRAADQAKLASDAVSDLSIQRKALLDLANEKINSLNIRISDLTTQNDALRTDSSRAWQTVRMLEANNGVLLSRAAAAPGEVVPIKKEATHG